MGGGTMGKREVVPSTAMPSPADGDREAHMASLIHRLATRLDRTAMRKADRDLASAARQWLIEEGMSGGMRQEQRPLPFPSPCRCGRSGGDLDPVE